MKCGMDYDNYYKMECYKISKLLNDSIVRKLIEVNDLSDDQYSFNKNLKFKTPMLRSDLCYYSVAYNVVKGSIDLLATELHMKMIKLEKMLRLNIMLDLHRAYQKLTH